MLTPFLILDLRRSFQNNERIVLHEGSRNAIYDIYIVELQKAKQNYFKDRAIYYLNFNEGEVEEKTRVLRKERLRVLLKLKQKKYQNSLKSQAAPGSEIDVKALLTYLALKELNCARFFNQSWALSPSSASP